MPIILYQFDISPFCDKVRRALNLKGVAYETRDPKMNEVERFKKMNPASRLPVLDHHGTIIADSSDILRFLEAQYPAPALYPADPALAAKAHILEDWADESLYFFELTMRLTWETNAPRIVGALMEAAGAPAIVKALAPKQVMKKYGRVVAAQGIGAKPRAAVLADLDRNLAAVDGLLAGQEWLAGPAISAADIAVYAQLFCIEGTIEGAPLVGARAGVTGWMRRVEAATGARR